MNSRCVITVFVFLIAALPLSGPAAESFSGETRERVVTVDEETGEARSVSQVRIKGVPDAPDSYILRVRGRGRHKTLEEARWMSEALLTKEDGRVRVQNSVKTVYSGGEIVFRASKRYDYENKTVSLEIEDKGKGPTLTKEFPIRGAICDDVTLVHVLDAVVPASPEGGPGRFYLLTNEPRLYHVMVKNRGKDTLNLPQGKKEADKIQLMADLGPLTEMAAKWVPATYVWMDRGHSERWLQYQGMEAGYGSAYIKAFVTEREKQP